MTAPGKPLTTQTGAHLAGGYAKLPLAFEPNVGQVDKRVRFLTHTGKGTLILTDTEAVLTLPCAEAKSEPSRMPWSRFAAKHHGAHRVAVVRMQLTGGQKPVSAFGVAPLPGVVNYLRGNNPKRWHTHVPTYRQARFQSVYKGVDMVYYGSQDGKLEYDFVVKPGADPKAIKLAFSGATGARVTPGGELRLQTAAGEVCWQRPVTYQIVGGHREAVACAYELHREVGQPSVGFRLASYDASRPVVIDPVLQYSTYLGGSGGDSGNAIAVDGSGSAYITGGSYSTDFPTSSTAYQKAINAADNGNAFVTKMSADGKSLVYSTYLGGAGSALAAAALTKGGAALPGDVGSGIAVDSTGNAYVTGYTYSSNFPTASAYQAKNNAAATNGNNVFVTKLNPTGSALVYSTYLGGSGASGDASNAIAIDHSGNAYVAGFTSSTNFPVTSGADQRQNGSAADGNGFVTELNAAGSSLIYSSYLGGTCTYTQGGTTTYEAYGDACTGIALDSSANAYVTGYTHSTNFPTVTPYQATNGNAAYGTAFTAKFQLGSNSTSSQLASLTLNPTSVTGGTPSTGTVTLTANAPTGGTTVTLSSGTTSVATVPATVKVSAGSKTATFTVTTVAVTSTTTVTISASLGGTTKSATLTVTAGSSSAALSSLTLNPTAVKGGNTSTGTVTLSANAPTGGTTITLSSGTTSVATVPASVTVAAGSKTATFTVTTVAVTSAKQVVITATQGTVSKTATLTVTR